MGQFVKWHYTTGDDLKLILESRSLIPGFANPFIRKLHKPAVWFTTNPEYEGTIGKVVVNEFGQKLRDTTKQELIDDCGGIARIGIADDVAPHNWQALQHLRG